MRLFDVLSSYKDDIDNDKLYYRLWRALGSDLGAQQELMESDFVITHFHEMSRCIEDGKPEERLVWFSILCYRLDLLANADLEKSHLLYKIRETLDASGNESAAVSVCLHLMNSFLIHFSSGFHTEFLTTEISYLANSTKDPKVAGLLQDFLFIFLTHPSCEQTQANDFFQRVHDAGIFLWLEQNSTNLLKVKFIEALFGDSFTDKYYKRIHAYQLFSQQKGIQPEVDFCCEDEVSRTLDPSLIKGLQKELYDALNIRLAVEVEEEDCKVLRYFLRKTVGVNEFFKSFNLLQVDENIFCITPSRSVYIHACKTLIDELFRLQHSIGGFLGSVFSRIQSSDTEWEIKSKYAKSNFKTQVGEEFQEARILYGISQPRDDSIFHGWSRPDGRHLLLTNNNRENRLIRVTRAFKEDGVNLSLYFEKQKDEDLSKYNLLIIFNDDIDTKIKCLNHLQIWMAQKEKQWKAATFQELSVFNEASNNILLVNVFNCISQLERLRNPEGEEVIAHHKKRKLKTLDKATLLNLKENTWKICPLIKSKPSVNFTSEQISSILSGVTKNCVSVNGICGSGKSTVISCILDNIYLNSLHSEAPNSRTLVVCDTEEACSKLLNKLKIIPPDLTLNLNDKISVLLSSKRKQLELSLQRIKGFAEALKMAGGLFSDVNAALSRKAVIFSLLEELATNSDSLEKIDFSAFGQEFNGQEPQAKLAKLFTVVTETFENLQQLQILSISSKKESLIESCDLLVLSKLELISRIASGYRFKFFDNLVICNVEYFQPLEAFFSITQSAKWQRIILSGDLSTSQAPYVIREIIGEQSFGPPLLRNFDANPEILRIRFADQNSQFNVLPGFSTAVQIIKSPGNVGEMVNDEEAEYCVLLFAYLRLIGYPPKSISILTMSPYQSHVIDSELDYWLGDGSVKINQSIQFGRPKCITTMEKNCSNRNDIVIISTSGSQPNMAYFSRFSKQGLFVFSESGEKLKLASNESCNSMVPKARQFREIIDLDNMENYVRTMAKST